MWFPVTTWREGGWKTWFWKQQYKLRTSPCAGRSPAFVGIAGEMQGCTFASGTPYPAHSHYCQTTPSSDLSEHLPSSQHLHSFMGEARIVHWFLLSAGDDYQTSCVVLSNPYILRAFSSWKRKETRLNTKGLLKSKWGHDGKITVCLTELIATGLLSIFCLLTMENDFNIYIDICVYTTSPYM